MKKAGMIAISLVVTAALVGGVGYGAYYTMQGKKDPIEVVPVVITATGMMRRWYTAPLPHRWRRQSH